MTTWGTRQTVRLAIMLLGITSHPGILSAEYPADTTESINGGSLASIEQALAGSCHDFSSSVPDGSDNPGCAVCHVFEEGPGGLVVQLNGDCNTKTTVYTTYEGFDLSSIPMQPDGVSRFCLSCHDGTIAMDVFGLKTGTINSSASLGTHLADDHPISIRYDASDREIRAVSTPIFFGDGSAGTIADLLEDGAVQCSSCHDVHNARAAGNPYLLNINNTRSALCMTCHAM